MTIAEHDCRDKNSNVLLSTAASDVLGRDSVKSGSTVLAAMMWSRLVTAGEPEYEAADTTKRSKQQSRVSRRLAESSLR